MDAASAAYRIVTTADPVSVATWLYGGGGDLPADLLTRRFNTPGRAQRYLDAALAETHFNREPWGDWIHREYQWMGFWIAPAAMRPA